MTDGKQWLVCYEESGRTQTASGICDETRRHHGARELERERGKIILSIESGGEKIPWEQARAAATHGWIRHGEAFLELLRAALRLVGCSPRLALPVFAEYAAPLQLMER